MDVLWLHRFTCWYAASSIVWCTSTAFCVQWLNCGCGALQTGRRLHCSHGRDSTVSSPSTQDVGLDLCNSKKKEQPARCTPIIPNRPKRTIEHLLTSPCFPRSLTDPFPQWCPDLRRWAIVRPVLWLLPGGCTHTPQYFHNMSLYPRISGRSSTLE